MENESTIPARLILSVAHYTTSMQPIRRWLLLDGDSTHRARPTDAYFVLSYPWYIWETVA